MNHHRPIPFYFINTTEPNALSQSEADAAMRRMADLGFGGIVLFNKPPTGFDRAGYLSDAWFGMTGNFVRAALKEGLELWVNDGFNFPPGDAGGRIEARDPALRQHRLHPNPDGRLEVVEVPWGFPAFEEPESSALFIELVYEEYRRRLGQYFGHGITGFFSDADNRRILPHLIPELKGDNYYPWSRRFPELFQERFGYRVEERLAGLFGGTDPQVARDYWRLAGDLYQQWFRNNHEWCRRHGLLYTFHTSDTGPLRLKDCFRSSLYSEGQGLALLRHSDCPGTDHELLELDGGTHYDQRLFHPAVTLGGAPERLHDPHFARTALDVRAKLAGSAAHLFGKKRAMCEMFAATNWGATYDQLRRIAAWQILQGINFIVPHAVHHRFFGETKFFAPPEFSHTTLAAGLRAFNDMLARACRAASDGELVAPIGVLDPTEAVWQGADPAPFFTLCDRLNRQSIGYAICTESETGRFACVIDPLRADNPPPPAPDATFDGGELAWMRRRLADGDEYLLVSNIWADRELVGTVRWGRRQWRIALEPGEIAVLGGPYEEYRAPAETTTRRTLPKEAQVRFLAPNLVPFEQTLEVEAAAPLALRLLVPEATGGVPALGGVPLEGGAPVREYDDGYLAYAVSLPAGRSTIRVSAPALFHTPCLLVGDFDATIDRQNDWHHRAFRQYMLDIYAPERMVVRLAPPLAALSTDRGWEQQGRPCYSGAVEYDLGRHDLAQDEWLRLPAVAAVDATLLVDGAEAASRAFAPYLFPLPAGTHRLALRVTGSMANRLERHAAPAGLLAPPEIVSFQESPTPKTKEQPK